MSYKEVLSQAYALTIRNPLLWIFGIVMLGGFNLFLINFFSLIPGGQWKIWPTHFENMFDSSILSWLTFLVAVVIIFTALNFVKIVFIVIVHGLIHTKLQNECVLCTKLSADDESQKPLPYLLWLVNVVIASAFTILLTLGITLAANAVLRSQGYDSPGAIVVNLLFIAVLTCAIGTWNIFTNYFIIWHGLKFSAASAAAIDLIVKRARIIMEFVILLSLVYSLSVAVGNILIQTWHSELLMGTMPAIRLIFLIVPIAWFAINNAFFNVAFLIFFDRIVKAIPSEKSEPSISPAA